MYNSCLKYLCFHYTVILAKYGMDGKRDTRPLENNSLKNHDNKEEGTFDDPKLDKLWNKVCPYVQIREEKKKLESETQ